MDLAYPSLHSIMDPNQTIQDSQMTMVVNQSLKIDEEEEKEKEKKKSNQVKVQIQQNMLNSISSLDLNEPELASSKL